MIDAGLRRRLVEVLEGARRRGDLGPTPVSEHLRHAEALARCVGRPPAWFCDLGSGAGVPGLVLACLWPTSAGALLESRAARCARLEAAVSTLGMEDRVAVVRGRAEVLAHDPTHRERYELVVSRAFGAPAVTAECGAGFVAVGGRLVVSEPPERSERWPPGALEPLGLGPARPCRETASFVVLRKEAPTPAVFPRRAGMPAKRPLF